MASAVGGAGSSSIVWTGDIAGGDDSIDREWGEGGQRPGDAVEGTRDLAGGEAIDRIDAGAVGDSAGGEGGGD